LPLRVLRLAGATAPWCSRNCPCFWPLFWFAAKIFQAAGFSGAEEATGVSLILGFFKLLMTGESVDAVKLSDVLGMCWVLVSLILGLFKLLMTGKSRH